VADPFREMLLTLADEIALAREAGLPVVLDVAEPLEPHAQRLMDTLGVEVRLVTERSAREVVATRICATALCTLDAESGSAYCRLHRPRAETSSSNGRTAAQSWSRKAKTREEVIEAIQRFAREHGRPPSRADFIGRTDEYVSPQTADRLFGSWSDAIVAAGFDRPTAIRRDAWTRERAIEKLQEVVAEHGAVPNSERLAGLGLPGAGAYNRLFGSWAGYVEAAGYERPTRRPAAAAAPAARSTARSAPPTQPDAPKPEPTPPAEVAVIADLDPLALTGDETVGWIARLEAESERLHRRAKAFDTIAEGLRLLAETDV
jgi:hypothetical protein